jgi:hypothetical protein
MVPAEVQESPSLGARLWAAARVLHHITTVRRHGGFQGQLTDPSCEMRRFLQDGVSHGSSTKNSAFRMGDAKKNACGRICID